MATTNRHEFPETPYLIYDLGNPPFIPVVDTLMCIQPVVPMISAMVANELTEKTHMNAGRMLMYNDASNCYWDNPYFSRAVQTAVDLLALEIVNERLRTPEVGAKDAVQQAIGFLVSELIVQHPALRGAVAPEVLHAAEQNIKLFQNRKQEISSMHSDYRDNRFVSPHQMVSTPAAPQYMNHQQVHQGHHGHFGHVPHMHPNAYPTPGMGHGYPGVHYPVPSNYPHGHHVPHPSHYHEQFHPGHGMPNTQPASFSNSSRGGTGRFSDVNHAPVAAAPSPQSERFDRFANTRRNDAFEHQRDVVGRYPTSGAFGEQPIVRETAPAKASAPDQIQTLTIDKGSEMDRSRHTITFLGESYSPNSRVRNLQFAEATEALRNTTIREGIDNINVDQNVYVEPNVESAIACGISKRKERQSDNDGKVSVFRCFISVAKPILCSEDVSEFVKSFRETSSFTLLAVRMKAVASALETKKETDNKYTESVISFLNQLDRIFTDVVNQFLSCELRLKTRIDSFAEDVSGLGDFLYSKYGTEYSNAFKLFEIKAIDIILNTYDTDVEQNIAERIIVHESLHMEMIPLNHSLTYVGLNERELGYSANSTIQLIDPDTAPSLYAIASSVKDHCKQTGFNTLTDLLITADGAVYRLHQSSLNNREFMISKV